MIIWIASYPKSGNTWVRSLLTSYFFSKDGVFDFELLKKIPSYPSEPFFRKYPDTFSSPESTAKYWIDGQKNINELNKNKLVFLKTHNAMCKINGYSFTDTNNTLGAIHVVRDPRNIITSICNHYQLDVEEALEFMKNKQKAIVEKKNNRYLGFNALFSWSLNQKSWAECSKFPVLTIKYEDLEKNTFSILEKIILFIKKISNSKDNFNKEKAKNVVRSCNFERLQKLEEKKGFDEGIAKKKSDEKVKFFNLGSKNNYKNLLSKKLINEMDILFQKDLIKYEYN